MDAYKFMQTCELCSASYQMGPHRYDGHRVPRYELNVCGSCYKYNWDGWSPVYEEKILSHLKQRGLVYPERNERGWLPRD